MGAAAATASAATATTATVARAGDLRPIVWSCLAFLAMGVCTELALATAPQMSGAQMGAVRVLANVVFVLACAPRLALRTFGGMLRGRGERDLWLWAVCGAGTVTAMYLAVPRIGVGLTSVLTATSGVFTALLAPWLLRERSSGVARAAIAVSIGGVVLMGSSASVSGDWLGWAWGLGSGVAAGLAYVAVARLRGRHSGVVVMTYWSVACSVVALVWLASDATPLPESRTAWGLAAGAGLFAALSQFFTARAYARCSATVVAALSYAAPALMLVVDTLAFGVQITVARAAGAALILAAGAATALVSAKRA